MTATSRMLGTTITADGVSFAVWAPKAAQVDIELQTNDGVIYHPLVVREMICTLEHLPVSGQGRATSSGSMVKGRSPIHGHASNRKGYTVRPR